MISTCTDCGRLYDFASEEAANEPDRECGVCFGCRVGFRHLLDRRYQYLELVLFNLALQPHITIRGHTHVLREVIRPLIERYECGERTENLSQAMRSVK